MDYGLEWDDVAEAHDIEVADFCNYVELGHPVLPMLNRPEAGDFRHRPVDCDCIAARYDRADYIASRS